MNKEIIIMTKKESERLLIINNLINKNINGTHARKQLGLSLRQVKRLKAKVITLGASGIIHASRGRTSNQKLNEILIGKTKALLRKKYYYFTPIMAQEHLESEDKIKLSKETVRQLMSKEGLWTIKKKKDSQHREMRERKASYGEMEQFDGSYDHWLYGVNEEQCLLGSIDDAVGKITGLHFDKNEGVVSVFSFWKRYLEEQGKPVSIYLDRFSTYKVNHKNAEDNKELITQFGRASRELGINLIFANSPQGKGRVERLWKTLQSRLKIEMRHKKIRTIEEANEFLKDFVPWLNAKYAVVPRNSTNLHRKTNLDLERIFSIQKTRIIGNDFVVRHENNYYQLEETQPVTILKKSTVIVESRLNSEIRIRQKNRDLNFFKLREKPKKEINVLLPALTQKMSDWKPPMNHPWKTGSFRKREAIINSKV